MTRLSRITCFLATVQRPTMLSPARWMTASEPDTDSGETGRAGSQWIWPSLVAEPRTRRTTLYPSVSREGTRAAPIGPETPLTRILEIMTERLSLYQFAKRPNKREQI